MKRECERDELEDVVESVLARFAIDVPRRRRWTGTLGDLRRALGADYEAPVASYVASGEFPVDELLRCAASHFPGINRVPLEYPATLAQARDRQRGLGLNVQVSPFGSPGHPLRGFYHREEQRRPLIWLNCQHTETAVGATLAHELGHHFWERVADEEAPTLRTLSHDGFVAHLEDPRELFADAFTAFGGYPRSTAQRLFRRSGWWGPQRRKAEAVGDVVVHIERHLNRHYAGDMGPGSGLSSKLRLYYLGSLVHFSKLRAALLRVTGH